MKNAWITCALALCCTGCGGADENTNTAASDVRVCSSNFAVDVRSGPSAPLHLEGKLATVVSADGRLVGILSPSETSTTLTDMTRVSGSVRDGQASMTFTLPGGRQVNGTGPWSAASTSCTTGTRMLGDATGPMSGDRGDWSGQVLVVLCQGVDCGTVVRGAVSALAYYGCFAACSYRGNSDAACDQNCR